VKKCTSRLWREIAIEKLAHNGESPHLSVVIFSVLKLKYMHSLNDIKKVRDNTVGSREVIPRIFHTKKNFRDSTLKLNQDEFDVLFGSVLGDAYITKKGRVQIEHSDKQKDYLIWKYKKLCNVVSTSVLMAQRSKKQDPSKKTISYRFWSKQYFHSWRNLFYPNGKKSVPKGIKEALSPLVMAVWYMDDGYLRPKKGCCLSTDSFSKEEVATIQKALMEKYDLRASIVSRNRLNIGVIASQKFFRMINPFVISSMRYKLP